MKNNNFINDSKSPELKLTDFSIQILELLEESIEKSMKEKIDNIFSTDSIDDNISEFQLIPLENGECIVKLSLNSELDPYFNFSFTVNSIEEGRELEHSWINKNKFLYIELLRIIKESI